MSVSGDITYTQTTNNIITNTFLLLSIIAPGETVNSDDYSVALNFLNMLVKTLQGQGLHLWTETEAYIYPVVDQISYQFGNSSSDVIANVTGTLNTTVSTTAAASATTINLTSVVGLVANQKIGIQLDSGVYKWTTIASVGASSVVINSAIPSSATAGNSVFIYTNLSGRALEISSVRHVWQDGSAQKLQPLSRKAYYALPPRTNASGTPVQFYTDKQRNFTTISFYPKPSVLGNVIQVTYKRIIDNFDNSNDLADFPDEWLLPLTYALAVCIAPVYGCEGKCNSASTPGAVTIANLANMYVEGMRSWDQENNAVLRIRPYTYNYGDQ